VYQKRKDLIQYPELPAAALVFPAVFRGFDNGGTANGANVRTNPFVSCPRPRVNLKQPELLLMRK
jgi:hypothetical protein